ncbi:MAG TPA: hypothetical protein VMW94_04375 [Actinomycetes bacterium]|nr:hypothetical protein [Actinomycetes bacterium]
MLGEAVIDADVTLTGIAAFNFATGASLVKSLKFTVEEEEMLVDLKALCSLHHSVVEGDVDYTLFLDGVDVAPLAVGLGRKHMPTVLNAVDTLSFERTMRVAKGEHQLQLHMKTGLVAGNIIVDGATWNGWLTARRHDHPATAAAQTNSKVQGVY